MLWSNRALIIMSVAALAGGCLAPEGEGGTEGAGPEEGGEERVLLSLPWSLTDCRVVVALVPVSADAVEAHLPDGFTAVSGEEAFALPPALGGEAVLGIETFSCASGSGLNGTLQDLDYGAYFTAVNAPEEHVVADADIQLFKWDTLVPDQDRRDVLQEHGLPAVDGGADLSGLQETATGHVFDVTVDLGGDVHGFQGTAGQPNEGFRQGFYFVEHAPANDGLAAWHMPNNEAPDALSGTGTVSLAAGSLAAQIVGTETSQAWITSATNVQFVNGTLELPGAGPA